MNRVSTLEQSLMSLITTRELRVALAVIALCVVIGNLYHIFGLHMLFLDDNARFHLFSNDLFRYESPRSFVGVGVMLKGIWVNILGNYTVELARLWIVCAYLVPLACLFFYFNRRVLQLNLWVSLGAAVIAAMIPKQVIPVFLDGSYPVHGSLVLVATLIGLNNYLTHGGMSWWRFFAAAIGWILVCDLLAEMGVFLLPAVVYLIYSSNAGSRRKLYIATSISIITALRLAKYVQTAGVNPSNKPTSLGVSDIIDRISRSFEWWLPYSFPGFVQLLLAGILIMAAAALLWHQRKSQTVASRAVLFYGLWFFACCFPFWFLSKYFGSRYFFLAYFALTALVFIVVSEAIPVANRHRFRVGLISLVVLFSFYGMQRYRLNVDVFERYNRKHAAIESLLQNEKIKADTQFALVNIKNGTGGYFIWSSGYLEYLLDRPGVRGIMGNEFNFYDPFNSKHCGYLYRMSCLDPDKTLIAYKQGPDYKPRRMNRFLQWMHKGERESPWKIFESNEDNQLTVVRDGEGYDAYVAALTELGFAADTVLWGDVDDEKAVASLK